MRNIKLVCFLLLLILGAAFAKVLEVEDDGDDVPDIPANTVTTLPPTTTVQFVSQCTQACQNGGTCAESLARCTCPAAWSGVACNLANTAVAYTATPVVAAANGQSVSVQVATDGSTFSQAGATMSTVAHTAADLTNFVSAAALQALNLTLAPQGLSVVFELNAVDGQSNPIHIVDRPVPVTVTGPYVNANTRLYVVLSGAIADAAATCPTQVRSYNSATNTLTTNVCHFTAFFTAQSQDGLNIPQNGGTVMEPACNNKGIHLASQGDCVCLSGSSGQTCANSIIETAQCNYTSTQYVHEGLYPHLNTADLSLRGFAGGNLFFSIDGPYVSSRMFASLTFRDSTDQRCNIGAWSSFWTQAPVGGAHCGDRYTISLPWTAHTGCGFGAPTQVANYNQYKATAVLSYFDRLGKVVTFGDDVLYRKTQVAFDIYVKFPAMLNVSINDISAQSVYVNKTYFTQNTYDRDTGLLTIAFTTFANWPNYLSQERLTLVTPNAAVAVYTAAAIDNSGCAATAGTTCRQVFTAQLKLNSGCDFSGVYVFQTTAVTCRDELSSSAAAQAATTCTKQAVDFQFKITGQDVCGHVEAAPSVAAKLKFTLADYSTLADIAEIGSTGYFKTDLIQSGGDNTITMKYLDITITDGTTTRWLLQNGVPDAKWANSSYANLQVLDGQFAFNINFATNVFFEVLPFKQVQYTFWARAAIRYAGNDNTYTKREEMMVQYYWKPEVDKFAEGSVATTINFEKKNVAAAETPAVTPAVVAPTPQLAVLGAAAVAGIAMIAGVIVVAVLRRRSASSSFRQLA